MKEIWKRIPDYPGYEISNLGRIKTFIGNVNHGTTHPAGYYATNIYKNGKIKRFYMHRLVAELFIRGGLPNEIVNHKDGNKKNNKAENLEWCSRGDNIRHAIKSLGKTNIGSPSVECFQIEGERWLRILAMPEYYVSSLGRVKKIKRIFGKYYMIRKQPYDRLVVGNKIAGYVKVFIKKKYHAVHRLVAEAFLINPFNLQCVNHKDGNPLNNHANNLEWISQSDNVKHGYKTRQSLKGEKSGSAKITEQDVKDIRTIWRHRRISQQRIGDLFGVHQVTVFDIVHRRKWKHI